MCDGVRVERPSGVDVDGLAGDHVLAVGEVVGGIGQELVSVEGSGIEASADWGSLRSPENYVGYERTENFASPGGVVRDHAQVYQAASSLRTNQWALAGDWLGE